MDEFGARVAAAARGLVGVPFRLHGRDEAGLDCVGLAALALARAGYVRRVPERYGLRSGDAALIARWMADAGLRPVTEARFGDLWLVRPGALQLHLMIGVPGGFVHAHAGLRRVVEMPGDTEWPVIGVWRVTP